jgi:hypothetical protein
MNHYFFVTMATTSDRVVVGVDLEATGDSYQQVFAVGFAVCRRNDQGKVECLERHLLVRDLGKLPNETWSEFWDRQQLERLCYDEFWSKHEDKLEWMMKEKPLLDATGLFTGVLSTMRSIEERYREADGSPNVLWAYDTFGYDQVMIGQMMAHLGAPMLNRHRNGDYGAKSVYLTSYLHGITRISPCSNAIDDIRETTRVKKYVNELVKRCIPQGAAQVEHDHTPANDAEMIARRFYAIGDSVAPTAH